MLLASLCPWWDTLCSGVCMRSDIFLPQWLGVYFMITFRAICQCWMVLHYKNHSLFWMQDQLCIDNLKKKEHADIPSCYWCCCCLPQAWASTQPGPRSWQRWPVGLWFQMVWKWFIGSFRANHVSSLFPTTNTLYTHTPTAVNICQLMITETMYAEGQLRSQWNVIVKCNA